MNSTKSVMLLTLGVGALVLLSTGCVATRRFVRNTTSPLDQHISKVDQQTAENAQQIRDVDKKSEAGIAEASNRADQANQAAAQANQAAGQADQHAEGARQLADKGLSAANQAQEMVDNIDNYHPTQSATVLFGLNKSDLTQQDQEHLDELADAVKGLKHYVIQIQGYTDTTGPKQYNIELSQRRSDAVVRYLTLNHAIPLVRIYSLGFGEAAPSASNGTRKGREINRRVEIKVLVPQMTPQAATQASAPGMNQ